MHVFLLIFTMANAPERIIDVCETYQECSDEGAVLVGTYATLHGVQPRDVTYRIVPAMLYEAKE